jgi:hypothetical protein
LLERVGHLPSPVARSNVQDQATFNYLPHHDLGPPGGLNGDPGRSYVQRILVNDGVSLFAEKNYPQKAAASDQAGSQRWRGSLVATQPVHAGGRPLTAVAGHLH